MWLQLGSPVDTALPSTPHGLGRNDRTAVVTGIEIPRNANICPSASLESTLGGHQHYRSPHPPPKTCPASSCAPSFTAQTQTKDRV